MDWCGGACNPNPDTTPILTLVDGLGAFVDRQKQLSDQKTEEISEFASELDTAHQLAISTLTAQWKGKITAS